jgi:hypothetical protein
MHKGHRYGTQLSVNADSVQPRAAGTRLVYHGLVLVDTLTKEIAT